MIALQPFDLKLEPQPGCDIFECASSAIRIARCLGVNVEFTFNEVRCFAVPQGEPDVLVGQYRAAIRKRTTFAHSVDV